MAYILDNKKANTERYLINPDSNISPSLVALVDTEIQATFSIGSSPTNYIFPETRPPGADYILVDTLGDGNLEWVQASTLGGGGSGNPSFNFKRIIDGGSNYILSDDDYAIEIVSDTYNSITLPTASGIGGRVYFTSRGSNNNNLIITAQNGELIDGYQTYKFAKKYTHMSVMSNNVNQWYII